MIEIFLKLTYVLIVVTGGKVRSKTALAAQEATLHTMIGIGCEFMGREVR